MHAPLPRPAPAPKDEPRRTFRRGRTLPRGVVWFGAGSFWGHLRHLIASGIATEDVDSRDWMTPDEPQVLADRITRHLGGERTGRSLVENLGRDLWIDYVADTGDDSEVSAAVARMLFRSYELPDPNSPGAFLEAPRGDILLFGGDTAYPVATVEEINNRVVVPFNRALAGLHGDGQRVLLGIPGNHDWYDGLDGFARMFRRRLDDSQQFRPSMLPVYRSHYADWAKEFVLGGQIEKLKTLDLDGYTPVQSASYFALPLSEHVCLMAGDRQLKYLDFRQKRFFTDFHAANASASWFVVLPNPVYAFSQPSSAGVSMIRALELDLEHEPHFVLSGDLHHYERRRRGATLHVVAGGGGAFLHPAPLGRGADRAEVEWPGPRQTRALLWRAPLKVAYGRSGFLPHLACLALYLPAVLPHTGDPVGTRLGPILVILIVSTLVYALIGGYREKSKRKRVLGLAVLGGAALASVPALVSAILAELSRGVPLGASSVTTTTVVLGLSCFLGALLFGFELAVFTALGLEHTQAFTALDHPGFKHFLRLRVRADGRTIDGWCVGLVNPLGEDEQPVLVDHFSWNALAVPGSPPGTRGVDEAARPGPQPRNT